MHTKDAALISSAISSINKFANDGNFMSEVMIQNNEIDGSDKDVAKCEETKVSGSSSTMPKSGEHMQPLSANQIAAKAMQLRLKGKHEEADRLLVRFVWHSILHFVYVLTQRLPPIPCFPKDNHANKDTPTLI